MIGEKAAELRDPETDDTAPCGHPFGVWEVFGPLRFLAGTQVKRNMVKTRVLSQSLHSSDPCVDDFQGGDQVLSVCC